MSRPKARAIRFGIPRLSPRRSCATTPPVAPNGQLHPKAPGKKGRRILPDAGFTVAEDDHNDVAPRPRAARDQAMAGRFGVTSLHSVAVSQPLQHFVRVLQLADSAVCVAKREVWQAND